MIPDGWIPQGWPVIEVFCDDPRHTRDHDDAHPVEAFTRAGGTGEWITVEQFSPSGPPQQTGWRDHYQRKNGIDVHSYRCDRCPRRSAQQIEVTMHTLQWLLNTVAEQGMSQPTLRILNLIVSKRA